MRNVFTGKGSRCLCSHASECACMSACTVAGIMCVLRCLQVSLCLQNWSTCVFWVFAGRAPEHLLWTRVTQITAADHRCCGQVQIHRCASMQAVACIWHAQLPGELLRVAIKHLPSSTANEAELFNCSLTKGTSTAWCHKGNPCHEHLVVWDWRPSPWAQRQIRWHDCRSP